MIWTESADELFARAVGSMYAPKRAAPAHTPTAVGKKGKRGRKRKSPERNEPAAEADDHVNVPQPVSHCIIRVASAQVCTRAAAHGVPLRNACCARSRTCTNHALCL
jgi:hypothetical protein